MRCFWINDGKACGAVLYVRLVLVGYGGRRGREGLSKWNGGVRGQKKRGIGGP